MTQLDLFSAVSTDALDPGMACAGSLQALDVLTEQREEEEKDDQ